MDLGAIYRWETDRAQGHEKRFKYHIFICDDVDGNHVFVYINSMDWYKDHKILKANYDFLEYDSFIGCNAVERYTPKAFGSCNPELKGQLSDDDMKALRNAIIAAETMATGDMNLVCKALAAIL